MAYGALIKNMERIRYDIEKYNKWFDNYISRLFAETNFLINNYSSDEELDELPLNEQSSDDDLDFPVYGQYVYLDF